MTYMYTLLFHKNDQNKNRKLEKWVSSEIFQGLVASNSKGKKSTTVIHFSDFI